MGPGPPEMDLTCQIQLTRERFDPRTKLAVPDEQQLHPAARSDGAELLLCLCNGPERILMAFLLAEAGCHQEANGLIARELSHPERDRVQIDSQVLDRRVIRRAAQRQQALAEHATLDEEAVPAREERPIPSPPSRQPRHGRSVVTVERRDKRHAEPAAQAEQQDALRAEMSVEH